MNEKLLSFRWWCYVQNKMIYVSWADILANDNLPYLFRYGSSDHIIMRAAMLLNDDKILYEGDIVSWSEYQGWEDGRTFHGFYIVKWNDDEQKWVLRDPFDNQDFDFWNTQWNDVVGNVYENKNLLPNEGEKEKFVQLN